MEFALGILLGSIFGVLADRLWQRIEGRVRVGIVPGFKVGINNPGQLRLTITNHGKTALPNFELLLFNPAWGTLQTFESPHRGELGPEEERAFYCAMAAGTFDTGNLESLTHSAVEGERKRASLRLVMSKGRRVLYESERVGTAIMEMLWLMAQSKSTGGIPGDVSWRACAQPESFFEWLCRPWRRPELHPSTGASLG